ncbi:MAG: hypothetical protein FWD45_02120, partial [Coriobacteriia bacterium]|nr:hypothetical protein [Coriobacteriia bacterium]
GRIVEAGTAYRTAALDPNNPSPVKALMNLGASFSALDRPGDAVEAYLAILEFRVTGTTLNRTYERLGGAYFANGQYAEAAQAFYDAMLGGGYELTERSQAQLAQAKLALSTGFTPVVRTQTNLSASGAMAAVNAAAASAAAGSDAASDYSAQLEDSSSLQAIDHEDGRNLAYGTDQSAETEVDFFTATDEELIEVSKRQARKERKQRHVGLKVFLAILIVIVLAFGAAIVAFTQGYGWPTQQATINSFFDSHASGSEVSPYWISTALDDPVAFNRILQSVAEVDSSAVTIIAIDRYISESEALIGVRLPEGGMIHYRVTLVRDGIGWKISRIELAFASQE